MIDPIAERVRRHVLSATYRRAGSPSPRPPNGVPRPPALAVLWCLSFRPTGGLREMGNDLRVDRRVLRARALGVATALLLASALATVTVGGATAGASALTHDAAFVTAAYQDFLGRPPHASRAWRGDECVRWRRSPQRAERLCRAWPLHRSGSTPPSRSSTRTRLGRGADPAGLNYWFEQINSHRLTVASVAGGVLRIRRVLQELGGGDTNALRGSRTSTRIIWAARWIPVA